MNVLNFSDLGPIRSACIELRIACFRLMSYFTFIGNPAYGYLAKQAGEDSLNALRKFSSDLKTSGIGPGFLRHYAYAKYVSESGPIESVEKWIGSPSELEYVCSTFHTYANIAKMEHMFLR